MHAMFHAKKVIEGYELKDMINNSFIGANNLYPSPKTH